jgi:hypothetical protein
MEFANDKPAASTAGLGVTGNTFPVADSTAKIAPRKGSKRWNVLAAFFDRAELGLNMFDAIRLARDYVLRTTVSELAAEYGVKFRSEFETVGNEFETQVKRYWLADGERDKVAAMLGLGVPQ